MADDQKDKIENLGALATPSKVPENAKAGAIFKEGMTSQQVSHEKKVGDIRAQLEALKELQKINPTPERNEQIMKLDRQWGRNSRFTYLHNRGTPEQKKILEKRETLEDLKASDVLMLKKKGADLANLLLVSDSNPTNSVTRDATKEGDKFIVNFGENKNINNVIGAADILPYDVSRVKINGVEGERKNLPRPGFYDIKTGAYLPIYDGDKMEVVKMGKVNEKDMKEISEAEEKWLRENRIDDTIENGGKALTDLPEDIELEKVAEEEKVRRTERRKRYEHLFGMGMTESMFRQYFGGTINEYSAKYDVPPDLVVTLIQQESKFDFNAVNSDTKAFGFGQHVPKWQSWEAAEGMLGLELDKEDPFHQVIATIGYLVVTKRQLEAKQGTTADWADAVIAYHTGASFDETRLERSMAVNKGIANLMRETTVAEYKRAAAEYYKVDGFKGKGYTEMLASKNSSPSLKWDNFIGMPAEKSENDVTLCSRTAQKNARLFGVPLPRGDALNARSGYSSEKLLSGLSEVPANSNLLDIFMKSGSPYGHRSIAIKNQIDNQWYVLDPYIASEKPVLLSDYASKNKIVNVVAHQATKVFAPELLAQV